MKFLPLASAIAATFILSAGPAHAQAPTYPNKPVTLVVGFAPGGATDRVARIIAKALTEQTKQTFVVENKAGANSNIGAEGVTKAKPDGYTLYVGSVSNTINQSLYKKLNFNVLNDFAPVATLTTIVNILVVNPKLPVKTVGEFIAYAKANPGKVSCASSGSGSSIHLSCELFKIQAGVDLLHVPYKGSGPAIIDLVGGQVDSMFDNLPSAIGQVRGDKLRALAVTSAKPTPFAPGVPTVSETGVPGFDVSAWFAVYAPKDTPPAIVDMLNKEINKALATEEVKKAYQGGGFELPAAPNTPAQLGKLTQDEVSKWAAVIKKSGIKQE
ncbi:MAG: tripartite tricarboxylate transporter substrate binding protein [Burkholderiaceae bacterium]|nr:tripartite tricarboxylate transporter substrate binding protein [Burkholderiaceae bacterium]